jgi:inosine/xanthosine triphosphatase
VKKIIVASLNPVKVRAALQGFHRMFPGVEFKVDTVSVLSSVSDQPESSRETLNGALARASNAAEACPEADYWVGIEGGVEKDGSEVSAFAWVVVKDKSGRAGKGRTGTFYLPRAVAELIAQGKELGEADDLVFKRANSKQDNGAVGILTGNVIDRTRLYEEAVILALMPFKNYDLYGS